MAHGAIPRSHTKDPLIADQVAVNCRGAGIADRHKAMPDFAVRVSQEAREVGEADFGMLAAQGFTEETPGISRRSQPPQVSERTKPVGNGSVGSNPIWVMA